jgi:hypothetical protein
MPVTKTVPKRNKFFTARPAFDRDKLYRLNRVEAITCLEYAIRKYPDLAGDVGKVIASAEIRERRDAIESSYWYLAATFYDELHPHADEFGEDPDKIPEISSRRLKAVIDKVIKDINEQSKDDEFDIAFRTLMLLTCNLTEVYDDADGNETVLKDVMTHKIQYIRKEMDKMAVLWIMKDGKVNPATHSRVLHLVWADSYEQQDEFVLNLHTVLCETRCKYNPDDNLLFDLDMDGERGEGEWRKRAGDKINGSIDREKRIRIW